MQSITRTVIENYEFEDEFSASLTEDEEENKSIKNKNID
jgi:hypothetical protein